MSCSASTLRLEPRPWPWGCTLLKLASRLLSFLAVILFLQNGHVEAASATARLGVNVSVVSRCRITTSSTEKSLDAQGTVGVDASVRLDCSKGSNAVISPVGGGITAGQASTSGNELLSYTISDVTAAGNDTKTLTINF